MKKLYYISGNLMKLQEELKLTEEGLLKLGNYMLIETAEAIARDKNYRKTVFKHLENLVKNIKETEN